MATMQVTVPSIGGSIAGETVYGWLVRVEHGELADSNDPIDIEVQPSREAFGSSEVVITYGPAGNRSSLYRLIEGNWRGGRLLSGSTLELYD